jgi:hypothetical protein
MGTIAHKDLTGADLHVNKGYNTNFGNGDLAAGVLTVTHSLSKQFLSGVVVTDNNGQVVLPDAIDFTSTSALTVDISSQGAITGTWHVELVY